MFFLVIFLSSDHFLLYMIMVHIRDRNMKHLEGKCKELEINVKNKNVIVLRRGINELKKGYQPWTDLQNDQKDNLHDRFLYYCEWIGGRTICFNYWMYFGLTLRLLMSYIYIYIYIYGAPILDVSRSHTTTQHSR